MKELLICEWMMVRTAFSSALVYFILDFGLIHILPTQLFCCMNAFTAAADNLDI